MKCKQCNKEYEAKRRTSKYCSAQCRKLAFQSDAKVSVLPERQATEAQGVIPNFGQPDCQCKHCQQNRAQGSRHIINHGSYKKEHQLEDRELNRIALPGDADFTGITPEGEQYGRSDIGEVVAAAKEENKLKRGIISSVAYSRPPAAGIGGLKL